MGNFVNFKTNRKRANLAKRSSSAIGVALGSLASGSLHLRFLVPCFLAHLMSMSCPLLTPMSCVHVHVHVPCSRPSLHAHVHVPCSCMACSCACLNGSCLHVLWTDRQTDQTDRQTDRQTDKQTDRQTDKQIDRKGSRDTG